MITKIKNAMDEFDSNSGKILALAYESGGEVALSRMWNEYDILRKAYFEILLIELNETSDSYIKLKNEINEATERMKESIDSLDNFNNILEGTTSLVNLIARIVVKLV